MDSSTIILIILAAIAVASLVGLLIAKPKRKNPYSSSSAVDVTKLTDYSSTRAGSIPSSASGTLKTGTTRSSSSGGALGGPGEVAGGAGTSTAVSGSGTRSYGTGYSSSGTSRVDRDKIGGSSAGRTPADTSDRSEAIYSFLRSDGLIHCPSCGVEHRKGTTVCVVCGQKL